MPQNSLYSRWSNNLQQRQNGGLTRTRITIQSPQNSLALYNGKQLLSFISNDYLGLANHPKIIAAYQQGADKYGVGSGASPILGGYCYSHQALEEELAEFINYPKVLLFSSGYAANTGAITALFDENDHIFADRLNHASLIDGCLFCKAKFERYQHLNLQDLQKKLEASNFANKLICSDGVFSMDGDIAPAKDLADLAKQTNSILMLDDAHGIGTVGKEGRGSLAQYNLTSNDIHILVGTLSKAFGTFGAFVASNELIIENLLQFARNYTYSTSLPPAIAEASRTSLKIVQQENWRRDHLQELINYFKKNALQIGLSITNSHTPIQPIMINPESGQKIYQSLQEQGILVGFIRPPTVPKNTTRLRVNLTVNHTVEQIDFLLCTLEKIIKSCEER